MEMRTKPRRPADLVKPMRDTSSPYDNLTKRFAIQIEKLRKGGGALMITEDGRTFSVCTSSGVIHVDKDDFRFNRATIGFVLPSSPFHLSLRESRVRLERGIEIIEFAEVVAKELGLSLTLS